MERIINVTIINVTIINDWKFVGNMHDWKIQESA